METPAQQTPSDARTALLGERSPEGRRRRIAQFGGTEFTENAVEAGLVWLAAHQQPDGSWDRFDFRRLCPANDRCSGPAVARRGDALHVGVTGLCLLAFLGAGYTDTDGPYPQAVRRAVEWLLAAQQPDGGFSRTPEMAGYNDALATLALAEYGALRDDPRVRAALARAVAHLVQTQQELGGWDYLPRPDSGRNDTSITAWVVQALRACEVAGVAVPRAALVRAALHFAWATRPDGQVRYADAGTGTFLEADYRLGYRYGPAMAAAGMTCGQILGWRADSPLLRRQEAILMDELPSAARARGADATQLHNEYYWYYGTLAMFQLGGARWERWNASLRDAILPLQDRRRSAQGRPAHSYGSWPAYGEGWGRWGRMGSRLYTTAICVLTLEVYYRHTPAFLADQSPLTASDWRAYLRDAPVRERRQAVEFLRQSRLEIGEPALLALLEDTDRQVVIRAAQALTELDSPRGLEVLSRALPRTSGRERAGILQSLTRARELARLPPVQGTVRLYDAGRRLATLDLARAYRGMELAVRRGERSIARLRVVQRFSGEPVVVAEAVQVNPDDPIRSGDAVHSLPEPGER